MKRILVTVMVIGMMVFTLGTATMANNVYFDYLTGGTFDTGSTDFDFTGMTLGTNFNSDKFVFNLEYAQDSVDFITADQDMTVLNGKGGYILSGDAQNHLALTVGYHQAAIEEQNNKELSGLLVGVDFVNGGFEASAGYSVSGTSKQDATPDSDVDVLQLNAKYSYFFTENFGVGVGYKYTQYTFVDDSKVKVSGPTVGVTYKF